MDVFEKPPWMGSRRPRETSLVRRPIARSYPGSREPSPHQTSEFVAGVDGDDAGAEVAVVGAAEAGAGHHRLELVLRRMLADRLGQILVTGGVVGEQLAQPRQHLEGMEVVD